MTDLFLDRPGRRLLSPRGRFDPWNLAWDGSGGSDGVPVGPREAVRWVLREAGGRRLPVAVIGPKRARPDHVSLAEALGRALAEEGYTLLTGGKGGVMEAASRGAFQAGGLTIGLLPDEEWTAANPFVTVPLASGIGPARNALIARAAFALVAVGGEYGTLSEMALGLHFGRLVLALADAPAVEGADRLDGVDTVLERLARRFLALD